jgi:hypothetical protein
MERRKGPLAVLSWLDLYPLPKLSNQFCRAVELSEELQDGFR